jgi:hypothetical protein
VEADDREPIEGKLDSNKKEVTIAENGIDKSLQVDWIGIEQGRKRSGKEANREKKCIFAYPKTGTRH